MARTKQTARKTCKNYPDYERIREEHRDEYITIACSLYEKMFEYGEVFDTRTEYNKKFDSILHSRISYHLGYDEKEALEVVYKFMKDNSYNEYQLWDMSGEIFAFYED